MCQLDVGADALTSGVKLKDKASHASEESIYNFLAIRPYTAYRASKTKPGTLSPTSSEAQSEVQSLVLSAEYGLDQRENRGGNVAEIASCN